MRRPQFTVCIPAYNRAHHLGTLLDSVLGQNYDSFEILICEDVSPERPQIAAIAAEYALNHPGKIRYVENSENLGYDANIRRLVELAHGEFCFFMGNDDLMCAGALAHVAELIQRTPNVGLVLKSYSWFDGDPANINQTVRYFSEERVFSSGKDAISVCYRRAGVISGYIVHRDSAASAATAEFDGSLYYQMHLTASVLREKQGISTPMVLVLCRNGEPPDFGNSEAEKKIYTPGRYTPQARLSMIGGAVSIIRRFDERHNTAMTPLIIKDYANYFYPYIKDQLDLPLPQFCKLYVGFARMGFWRSPLFHAYFFLGYILKEKRFDDMTRMVRNKLGRSPQFGIKK